MKTEQEQIKAIKQIIDERVETTYQTRKESNQTAKQIL